MDSAWRHECLILSVNHPAAAEAFVRRASNALSEWRDNG